MNYNPSRHQCIESEPAPCASLDVVFMNVHTHTRAHTHTHSQGKPDGVHYGQLDHAYKKKKATVTPAPTSPPPTSPKPTSPPPAAQLASATAEGEYGKLDRVSVVCILTHQSS